MQSIVELKADSGQGYSDHEDQSFGDNICSEVTEIENLEENAGLVKIRNMIFLVIF